MGSSKHRAFSHRRPLSAAAASFIFCLTSLPGLARVTAEPDLKSGAALVVDQSSSTILFARRPDVALPIASITKLMTALVVLDAKLPLDERIELVKADCPVGKGAYSRLAVGTRMTRGDLLHLALMSSENRAARALGRTYPGGMSAFVKAMNVKAKALGMTQTRFVDPAGLSEKNVASPADLVKLVGAASRRAIIREFSTDHAHAITAGRRTLEFHNTNSLVSNPGWDIALQKTGYIAAAGRCLVMQAVIDGRVVVMILLDSYGKYTRVADARRIKTWMEGRRPVVAAGAIGAARLSP